MIMINIYIYIIICTDIFSQFAVISHQREDIHPGLHMSQPDPVKSTILVLKNSGEVAIRYRNRGSSRACNSASVVFAGLLIYDKKSPMIK